MWYCKCGKVNNDNKNVCWSCGKKNEYIKVVETEIQDDNNIEDECLNFSETQINDINNDNNTQQEKLNFIEEPMQDSNKKGDNILVFAMQVIFCLAGIVGGIASIAMVGTGPFWYDSYGRVNDINFGADFYTEIYGATRVVAKNLDSIVRTLTDMANALFVFAGIFAIAYFGLKLFKIIEARMK